MWQQEAGTVHMRTHTHMHTYMPVCTHIHIHVLTHTFAHTSTHLASGHYANLVFILMLGCKHTVLCCRILAVL